MLHGRPGLQLLFRTVAAKGQLLLWAAPSQQPEASGNASPELSSAGAAKAGNRFDRCPWVGTG